MKLGLIMLLTLGLGVSPLLARAAGETGKEETPSAAKTASATTETSNAIAKPESPAIDREVQDLRGLVEELRSELESQQRKVAVLEEKLGVPTSEPNPAPAYEYAAALATPAAKSSQEGNEEISPLQFKIGSAYITPVGFMDFTGVYRSHDEGTGIGTNFAGIKYGNSFNTHLTELAESMQNSRIGFRVDAMVKGAHVIGYMESDFLGNNPLNVAVSSNSNTLRSRLYWVDIQKSKWEILAGQTWSLITPGRSGISPIPSNIFYTANIDVNYQAGLVWGRIPELRLILRPTEKFAVAVALDNPDQYTGGSAGGATITYPSNLSALANSQLNAGSNLLATPNVAPDVIVKAAYDPSSKYHFEVGGLVREFKVWNSLPFPSGTSFSKSGAGGFVNANVELLKGFRVMTSNFWADGGGRYIFGQVPDLIVRADNTISPIKAASTVSGFEYTHRSSFLYAYYGGIYVYKNLALDSNRLSIIGYGVPGSSVQNRLVQEGTVGFNQTIWKDAKFGALNFTGQFSYVNRKLWATLDPSDAHVNMGFLNLRYTLPGSAPTMGK
ncbi:MAG TPA: hypothetical protein VHS29_07985 [Candidatus Acidoferrales bacterium]|jgi:hypothetical protein|nr:hypothetical protein [Candidatus Acidoferrales bacterium]